MSLVVKEALNLSNMRGLFTTPCGQQLAKIISGARLVCRGMGCAIRQEPEKVYISFSHSW